MKRTMFSQVCSIVFAAVATLVSCDKTSTTPQNPDSSTEITNVIANCTFETSQDILDYYDVTYFYSVNGEEAKKETLTELKLNIVKKYEKGSFPKSVSFKVVATPKKDHKQIVETNKYTILKNKSMIVKHVDADGLTKKQFYTSANDKKTLSGTKFQEYIAKKGEMVFVDYTYTPDQAK